MSTEFRALSGPPSAEVAVPEVVAGLAAGGQIEPVWRNELGGVTFRIGDRYVKWTPVGTPEIDLGREAERLRWAGRWVRVPRVLDEGADEAGAWLVTAAIPGLSAVDPAWVARPADAARAIGRGLRALHDTLPAAECPFSWGVSERLAVRQMSASDARGRIGDVPPIDRLVVCHGDACAPNTLLDEYGGCIGHVDFGSMGLADRWADLAVAAWSTEWNYGEGYAPHLYEAYGIEPDRERIAFYRLLWDLA